MKQLRFLISTIALAAVLTSCGGRNTNDGANQTQSPTAGPTETNGVMNDITDAAGDVTNGVGEGVKDVGNAVKDAVR